MSERARGWRKLAQATWGPPKDPQFYGEMELDAGPLLTHLAQARERADVPITVTHVVAKAVAYALTEVPAFRLRRAWGRSYERESTDVFVIATADEAGGELTGVKIERADVKSVTDIASELHTRVTAIRDDEDETFGRSKAMLSALPPRLLRLVVVRPMLTLTATFDHRYVDGLHAAKFADAVRRFLSDPAVNAD